MTIDDAVAGIAATITGQGLKCRPVRDGNDYPRGVQVSDARMRYLEDQVIERGAFGGEWNYAIRPVPRPAARPEPEPARPGRVPPDVLNHPALTGMQPHEVTALAATLEIPFEAHLQQRYRDRRGGAIRSGNPHRGRRPDITGHLLALRLRQHLALPVRATGVLPGVDPATVSHATTLAGELLAAAKITLPDAPPENLPRTPAELPGYAAAAGIPLTLPENGQQMPEQFKPRTSRSTRNTPEPANYCK